VLARLSEYRVPKVQYLRCFQEVCGTRWTRIHVLRGQYQQLCILNVESHVPNDTGLVPTLPEGSL
jgi:hypothetical protein